MLRFAFSTTTRSAYCVVIVDCCEAQAARPDTSKAAPAARSQEAKAGIGCPPRSALDDQFIRQERRGCVPRAGAAEARAALWADVDRRPVLNHRPDLADLAVGYG